MRRIRECRDASHRARYRRHLQLGRPSRKFDERCCDRCLVAAFCFIEPAKADEFCDELLSNVDAYNHNVLLFPLAPSARALGTSGQLDGLLRRLPHLCFSSRRVTGLAGPPHPRPHRGVQPGWSFQGLPEQARECGESPDHDCPGTSRCARDVFSPPAGRGGGLRAIAAEVERLSGEADDSIADRRRITAVVPIKPVEGDEIGNPFGRDRQPEHHRPAPAQSGEERGIGRPCLACVGERFPARRKRARFPGAIAKVGDRHSLPATSERSAQRRAAV